MALDTFQEEIYSLLVRRLPDYKGNGDNAKVADPSHSAILVPLPTTFKRRGITYWLSPAFLGITQCTEKLDIEPWFRHRIPTKHIHEADIVRTSGHHILSPLESILWDRGMKSITQAEVTRSQQNPDYVPKPPKKDESKASAGDAAQDSTKESTSDPAKTLPGQTNDAKEGDTVQGAQDAAAGSANKPKNMKKVFELKDLKEWAGRADVTFYMEDVELGYAALEYKKFGAIPAEDFLNLTVPRPSGVKIVPTEQVKMLLHQATLYAALHRTKFIALFDWKTLVLLEYDEQVVENWPNELPKMNVGRNLWITVVTNPSDSDWPEGEVGQEAEGSFKKRLEKDKADWKPTETHPGYSYILLALFGFLRKAWDGRVGNMQTCVKRMRDVDLEEALKKLTITPPAP